MSLHPGKAFIKDICGITASRKGEAYCRTGKVEILDRKDSSCEAAVHASETFHVSIRGGGKNIQASCSCPPLGSFQKYCQHIAAVLHWLNTHKSVTDPAPIRTQKPSITNQNNELISLFTQTEPDAKKKIIFPLQMIFRPILHKGQQLLEASLTAGSSGVPVSRPLDLTKKILNSGDYIEGTALLYSSDHHTVPFGIRQILGHLEEKAENMLSITPGSFKEIIPYIQSAADVRLEAGGLMAESIQQTADPLPINFHVAKTEDGCTIGLEGFFEIAVLPEYNLVLYKERAYILPIENVKRLAELYNLLRQNSRWLIHVPSSNLSDFQQYVLPGLRKLGAVHLEEHLLPVADEGSFTAKLYLDRIHSRLLAGLEFHYGRHVIEAETDVSGHPFRSLVSRDTVREQKLIQILRDASFIKSEGGYYLQDEEEEFRFLTHTLPLLQEDAEVYATAAVSGRLHKGKIEPKLRIKWEERTDWLDVSFDLKGIPEEEIKAVLSSLKEKRPFHKLASGALLSLETSELGELKRLLNEMGLTENELDQPSRIPLKRGMRLFTCADESGQLEFDRSFQTFVESLRNLGELRFNVPASLRDDLRTYQKEGYNWLKTLAHFRFGGILADDMGLGKTIQSIAYIVSELEAVRKEKKPILVLCPSSLTYNWLDELGRFAPEAEAVVIDGAKKERQTLLKDAGNIDVIITSYPLIRQDWKEYRRICFHTMFLDEAQALKNHRTLTAKAVKRIQSDHCFGLTGTPVENSLSELWSLFDIVFPGYLPVHDTFIRQRNKKIAAQTSPFILRRMKKDVLPELPQKKEHLLYSSLLPEQENLYAAYLTRLRHETLKHIKEESLEQNKIRILAGITRLRQICCHPALFVEGYTGSSGKFEQLLSQIDKAHKDGKKLLIFSQFTGMLHLIGQELTSRGLPYFYLDGSTPSAERVSLCAQFNESDIPFFLISLKAGGNGLNLTGADTVILYDLWWNPAVEEQAADRVYRIGQKQDVEIIRMAAKGTVEEKMVELQKRKKDMIQEVIKSGGASLSSRDIREILMM